MIDANRARAFALAAVLWSAAVLPGVWHLRDVQGPYDWDGFRDVAAAQAVADGLWGADPVYKGEGAWYPPLIPAAVALTSDVVGVPMARAYILAGLWINALIPGAFFLCARRLLGDWPALVAMCGFLFLPGRPPAWAAATYSPWLFPSVAAQIPFFLSVWTWIGSLQQSRIWRAIASGALLGLTFLTHSAPAIVLAGIMAFTAVRKLAVDETRWGVLLRLLVLPCTVALLVISPFIVPIAHQYGFTMLNGQPAQWAYEAAQPSALVAGFAKPSAAVNLVVFIAGAIWVRRSIGKNEATILLAWVAVSLAGLSYGLAAERWPMLHSVVPAFHFLFLLRTATWLLFGCGVALVFSALSARSSQSEGKERRDTWLKYAVVVLLFGSIYPRYLGREAFTKTPQLAAEVLDVDERDTARWIHENTSREAVFVASDLDALQIVAPSGRFAVSVQPYFSNPYVDYQQRASARNTLLGAAMGGDRDAFERVRPVFDVSHMLVRGAEATAIEKSSAGWLRSIHHQGSLTVFEVVSSSASH